MNREKAKLVLQSCRPGGQDRDDPMFAEALEFVERDPELKQWFNEQQAFDTSMASSVQSLSVPDELQQKLIAEVRNARAGAADKVVDDNWWRRVLEWGARVLSYPILTFRARSEASPGTVWRSRPVLVPAAVVVLLAGVLAFWWNTRPTTFSDFCQEITESAWELSPHLQFESQEFSQVANWLAAHQAQTNLDVPAGLQNAHLRGCSIIQWHGHKIPVLCLLEGSSHMHLLLIDPLVVKGGPAENQPELRDYGLIRTASWKNKDRTYVLTGLNVRTFVKKFRQAGHWNFTS